jgi:hypothetical protein
MNQPQKRLAKALLELEPAFTKEFLENERKKKERAELVGERPRDGFYDTTAWSLPLLFGVDAFWSAEPVPIGGMDQLPSGGIVGSTVSTPPDRARYAYAFTAESLASMSLAARLLAEGFNLAVATEPFRAGGRDYPRGTILARTERNTETLHQAIARGTIHDSTGRGGAAEWWLGHVPVSALDSARVETGPDLGEDPIVELAQPRIAVITDEPTDDRSYGATWFTLERRLGYPFTALKAAMVRSADLARYDVVVFPHGSPAAYQETLGTQGIDRLRRWTQDGGTLVLIKGAAAMATRKGVEWTSSTLKRDEASIRLFFEQPPTAGAAPPDTPASPASTGRPDLQVGRAATRNPTAREDAPAAPEKPLTRELELARTPGAILRVKVDPQHFLGFGYERDVAATVQSNYAFTISRTGQNAAAFADEPTVKLAGFMWPEVQRAMARTLFAWVEPSGRGNVILFAEDPNFRATQLSTLRMFFNAVFLGPSFARRF